MATDKPAAANASFSELDAIETPAPFVYTTKASKRVTFPDLYELPSDEAEEFLLQMGSNTPNSVVLKRWLSEEDYEALKADKLSLRKTVVLLQKVQAHYELAFGSLGEGAASES